MKRQAIIILIILILIGNAIFLQGQERTDVSVMIDETEYEEVNKKVFEEGNIQVLQFIEYIVLDKIVNALEKKVKEFNTENPEAPYKKTIFDIASEKGVKPFAYGLQNRDPKVRILCAIQLQKYIYRTNPVEVKNTVLIKDQAEEAYKFETVDAVRPELDKLILLVKRNAWDRAARTRPDVLSWISKKTFRTLYEKVSFSFEDEDNPPIYTYGLKKDGSIVEVEINSLINGLKNKYIGTRYICALVLSNIFVELESMADEAEDPKRKEQLEKMLDKVLSSAGDALYEAKELQLELGPDYIELLGLFGKKKLKPSEEEYYGPMIDVPEEQGVIIRER